MLQMFLSTNVFHKLMYMNTRVGTSLVIAEGTYL